MSLTLVLCYYRVLIIRHYVQATAARQLTNVAGILSLLFVGKGVRRHS